MVALVIRCCVCLAIILVCDRIFIGASESGMGHCIVSVIDLLVCGVCFIHASVSGGPVFI